MTALDAVHGQTTLLDLDYTYDYNGNCTSKVFYALFIYV